MSTTEGLFPSSAEALVKANNFSDVPDIAAARGNLHKWTTKTADYTAVDGDWIRADTSSSAWTLTLPPSPADGAVIRVKGVGTNWATNNLTIARNGNTIDGVAEDGTCDTVGIMHTFTYVSADGNWEVDSDTVAQGFDPGAAPVLLTTINAAADSTVEFTSNIDDTYDRYEIIIDKMSTSSDAVDLHMRVSFDGGTTWDTGSNYRWVYYKADESSGSRGAGTSNSSIRITSDVVGAASGEGNFNGHIYLHKPSDTNSQFLASGRSNYIDSSGEILLSIWSGRNTKAGGTQWTSTVDAVQIYADSGTITGTFKLYGIR